MTPVFTRTRISLLAFLLLAVGCSSSEPPATAPVSPLKAAADKANELSKAAEQAAQPAPAEEPAAPTPQAAYKPPYPDRRNLFSPPKQLARLPRQSETAESVVLLGFAKIDEPSVVLAINGRVTPLSHGQESAGVRVISIDPPRAVLQRGRNRWSASIE